MSTIASLAVALTANHAGLANSMASGRSELRSFGSEAREVGRIFAETRTPTEQYELEVERLIRHLNQGRISFETFERAGENARRKLEEATRSAEESGSGIARAGEHWETFRHVLEAVAAYEAVRRIGEFVKSSLEAAEQTVHFSERLGVTAEQFGRLQYAAEAVGVGTDSFVTAVQRMERSLGEANAVGGQTAAMLDQFGIHYRQLIQESPTQAFNDVTRAIEALGNPFARATAAQAVFGRGWGEIIPLLKLGSEGLADLGEKAQRSGYVLSDVQAEAAFRATMAANEFHLALDGLGRQIAVQLVPMLQAATHEMESWAGVARSSAGPTGVANGAVTGLALGVAHLADGLQAVRNVAGYVDEALMEIGSAALYVAGAGTSLIAFLDHVAYYGSTVATLGLSRLSNFKGTEFDAIDDKVHSMRDLMQGTIAQLQKDIDDSHQSGGSWGDKMLAAMQKTRDEVARSRAGFAEMGGAVGDAARGVDGLGDAIESAHGHASKLVDPFKELNRTIGEIQMKLATFGGGTLGEQIYKLQHLANPFDLTGHTSTSMEDRHIQLEHATFESQRQQAIGMAQSLAGLEQAFKRNHEAAERQKQDLAEFNRIVDKSPFDKFLKQLDDMASLLNAGAISVDQYLKAFDQVSNDYDRAAAQKQEDLLRETINAAVEAVRPDVREVEDQMKASPAAAHYERHESATFDPRYMRVFGDDASAGRHNEAMQERRRHTQLLESIDSKLPQVTN